MWGRMFLMSRYTPWFDWFKGWFGDAIYSQPNCSHLMMFIFPLFLNTGITHEETEEEMVNYHPAVEHSVPT